MTDFVTPTTQLQAINEMLRTIGESPVDTITSDDPLPVDVEIALNCLRMCSREVQARGWHFNTEIDYPLAPDVDGYLQLPSNAMRVDTTAESACKYDVVVRGGRLYNRVDHTYVFTETVKVEMVIVLPYEDLPESARTYIYVKAARRFQAGQVGSQILAGLTQQDELNALALMQDAEGDTADFNILTGTWDMFETTQRY